MYFLAVFTALLAGTLAQDSILPNNNWLHYLGKKNSLLDPLITPILPFDLSKFELLSRRNAVDWLFSDYCNPQPDNETLLQWIHTLGKKSVLLDPLIPINDTIFQWIHTLGKKSILLDPVINQLLTVNPQWINLLGKRSVSCIEDPLLSLNPQWINLLGKKDANCVEDPALSINPLWINLLGKRAGSWSDIVKAAFLTIDDLKEIPFPSRKRNTVLDSLLANIDWNLLQPLVSGKKRDINSDPFSTFNPLILSKKGLDALSNPFLMNPILIGGKKRRQSIVSPTYVLGQPTGHYPLIDLILSKKRRQSIVSPTYVLGQPTGHYPLIDLILSKKRRQSIVSPIYILGQPIYHSLTDLIASKRNIESIAQQSGTVFNGIIPFDYNLILSKKRDVVFDPSNTNPFIISKKRDVVFDPLNTNPLIISKKRNVVFLPLITNPLIISKKRDVVFDPTNTNPFIISKKRDVVFDPSNTNPFIISEKRDFVYDPLHPNVAS